MITQGAQGGGFYLALAPGNGGSTCALGFCCALNQVWFMGLFFLLAGCFTPAVPVLPVLALSAASVPQLQGRIEGGFNLPALVHADRLC